MSKKSERAKAAAKKSEGAKMSGANLPLVQVSNLSKTFQEGVDEKGKPIVVRALQGVTFDIYPGEFIAITGPNGSGKSTLINCLGAFEKADTPEDEPIKYADNGELHSVWQSPEWYRQNFIGIVFQDFHLLPTLRVGQNVEFPLRLRQCRHYNGSPIERQQLVNNILKVLGIEQHQGKKVNQISGGERQRVAIARALVKEPRLLLADEPTGNLDQHNKVEIVRQLRKLAKDNLSVLMVTHDRELAENFADRIIHLVDGKIDLAKSKNFFPQRAVVVTEPDVLPPKGAAAQIGAGVALESSAGGATSPAPVVPDAAGAPAAAEAGASSPAAAAPAAMTEASASGAGQMTAVAASNASPGKSPVPDFGPPGNQEPAALLHKKERAPKPPRAARQRRFFTPLFSQSFRDLVIYSLRDARASTVSLASNVFAILLGTFLTAMLLALLSGTEEYIRYLFRTIPGIDSVHVWVDYSTGEAPMSGDEVNGLSSWPGAQAVVPSVNQFVPLFQKPTREVIASLFSTQNGDPEVERLQLAAGSLDVNAEGWDVILPMRIAEEINNFNPEGLAGTTITLQLRRYDKTAKLEAAKPTETLDYPVRVVGIVKSSPQDRVYGSLAMTRFVRDFSTGRSDFTAQPGGQIDVSKISPRTLNESLRIHFGSAAAAEKAFLEMKRGGKQRFESAWPGEKMLYLRDVETISTIVLLGIGLLAIVAGAVSIFNTLLASVARKTKEIGIMRALGVTRLDIFLIFLLQSVIIGILACVVGLIIAGATTYPLNAYVGQRWDQLADAMKSIGGLFQFSVPVALSLVAAVLAICLVAAFLPALRAASKTPMDALREQ